MTTAAPKKTPARPRAKPAAAAAAPPPRRWRGALEGLHRGMLYGWAIDSAAPDARTVLEICLDDELLGCVVADVARSDLAAEFDAAWPGHPGADHCHGFIADLGQYTDKDSGRLTARVANTGVMLPGHLDRADAPKPPISAASNVFGDGALRLQGWALDPLHEHRILRVRAFVGHEQVAEAEANLAHPALRSYEVGKHGFRLDLPPELGDGQVHSVRVVDQDGNALNGSPLTICCHVGGMKTLLPGERPADLLDDVIDIYERHLPRSLAMAHYDSWARRFEHGADAPAVPAALAALRIGVLIDDAADTSADATVRTVASLNTQQATARLYAGAPLASSLRQALDDGCDLLACVRAGDTLAPQALAHALAGLALPGAELVYTDSEQGGQPWFKPAWNPDYALTSDYPLDLMLFRASALPAAVAALPSLDQASLAWAVLGALWTRADQAIIHVPRVLYHRHTPLGAAETGARDAAAARTLAALEPDAMLAPLPLTATMPIVAATAARRLRRPLTAAERGIAVTLIIPTRDRVDLLRRCIDSIARHTPWERLEIIVIDNDSTLAETKAYFRKLAKQGVRVLAMPGPFNYADLNNRAVAAASGELIGLINNDIEALHEGWLDELVGQLLRPGVGMAGAKLLWPNGMVQHGGVLLGVGNVAGHFGNQLADADWGDHGRNQLVQQVSGVTAACLLLRKADFLAVGGMDAHAFPVAFNDVDLCLKLRGKGKAIVWTPHARMLHAESASRGHEDTPQKRARAQREIELLRLRWGGVLLRDPAYHPSLNLDPYSQSFGGLALPPRPRGPRRGTLAQKE